MSEEYLRKLSEQLEQRAREAALERHSTWLPWRRLQLKGIEKALKFAAAFVLKPEEQR